MEAGATLAAGALLSRRPVQAGADPLNCLPRGNGIPCVPFSSAAEVSNSAQMEFSGTTTCRSKGKAQDGLAVEAVSSEPVSTKSQLLRENTGNFDDFGCSEGPEIAEYDSESTLYVPSIVITEQGISGNYQGKRASEQAPTQ
jgi:hypothetical protein